MGNPPPTQPPLGILPLQPQASALRQSLQRVAQGDARARAELLAFWETLDSSSLAQCELELRNALAELDAQARELDEAVARLSARTVLEEQAVAAERAAKRAVLLAPPPPVIAPAPAPASVSVPPPAAALPPPRLLDTPGLRLLAAQPSAPTRPELERLARQPAGEGGLGVSLWNGYESPRIAWLGVLQGAQGHARIVLRRRAGDNIALSGAEPGARAGMLLGLLSSFALNLKAADSRFLIIDRSATPWTSAAASWCRAFAAPGRLDHRLITDDIEAEEALKACSEEIFRRRRLTEAEAGQQPSLFVVLIEPERLPCLARIPDVYGNLVDSAAGASLRRLLAEGPVAGVHVLLSSKGSRPLFSIIDSRKALSWLRHRVLLQMPAEESLELCGGLEASLLQKEGAAPLYALQCESGLEGTLRFRPYLAQAEGGGLPAELPALATESVLRWSASA